MAKTSNSGTQTAKQAKNSMIICLVIGILLLAGFALYTAFNWNYMILGKTKNLNAAVYTGEAPEKGEDVTLTVRFVLGNYAETKHRINGFIPAGTDQHYAIVLEDGSVMGLTLKNSSDIEKLEKMAVTTWAYFNGDTDEYPMETIEFTGSITTMDTQIRKFYHDALSKANITTEYFTNIYELALDATDSRLSRFGVAGLILLFAALCFGGFFGSKKRYNQLKNVQAIARENAADPSLNPFLQQNQGEAAAQNPYMAGQQDMSQNPYMAGQQDMSQNPYMSGQQDMSQNPYMNGQQNAPQDPYGNYGDNSGNYPPQQ